MEPTDRELQAIDQHDWLSDWQAIANQYLKTHINVKYIESVERII